MNQTYLFRPAVGDAPGGVGATGNVETTAPLIMRSVPSGELASTVPLVTKSNTSAEYSTGLSVWMKRPVAGQILRIGRLPALVIRVMNGVITSRPRSVIPLRPAPGMNGSL